jgi:hypothetical protein
MELGTLVMMETVETGSGVPLIVNRLSYGVVPVESVLDGTAKPIAATLTSDGRSYFPAWHDDSVDGPCSDESVYVERWTAAGRDFHGFIDKASRKIVQTG